MGSYMRSRPQAVGAFGLAGAGPAGLARTAGLHHLMTVTLMNLSGQDLIVVSGEVLGATVWSQEAAAEGGTPLARQSSALFAMASTDAGLPTEGRILLSTPQGQPVMVHVSGGGRLGNPVATVATGSSGLTCSIQVNKGTSGSDVTISLSQA